MPRQQGTLFPAESDGIDLRMGERLNAQQRNALLRSLDENGFLSITGPPGTGKTLTIHAIIDAYMRQNGRVLVAALTNNAIDNVIERLIGDSKEAFAPFLRFGSRSAMMPRFIERLGAIDVDARRHFAQEIGLAFSDLTELREQVESIPIYVGTAHSLLRSPWIADTGRDGPPFDLVIVDEATQMQEPLAAALLTLGKKAILVGDEHQLGPVCLSTFDSLVGEMPESLREIGLSGLKQSLFERLNRLLRERGHEEGQVFLSRQYRMHPVIGEWVSEQFYDGRLETAPDTATRCPELRRATNEPGWNLLGRILDPERPFVFLDVPGGARDLPNTCAEEARVAALLTFAMSKLGMDDVGCITPYRNQQATLRRELRRFDLSAECGTVDAFQGREKTVVILSTVRRDRLTEFLCQPRRLNVSVTRARAKCVILGSPAILREHPLMWSLVSHPGCVREQLDAAALRRELGLDGDDE